MLYVEMKTDKQHKTRKRKTMGVTVMKQTGMWYLKE